LQSCDKVKPALLVSLAAALLFFYGFLLGGMQLVIADIARQFKTSQTGMGLLVSAQHITAVIAPVCMGAVADRAGKKKVLLIFIAVFSLGCAIAGFSGTLGVYVMGAALIGGGYSVCESLCSAVMSDLDPIHGMRYISITQCLLSVGAVLGPVLVKLCIRNLGADWRLVFWICAAAFAALMIPFSLARFPAAVKNAPGRRTRSAVFFSSGVFVCLFASIILYVGLENGFGYFVDTLFTGHLKAGALSAYALSAYWAGMALSRLLFGLRPYRAKPVLLSCFAASGTLFVLLAVSPWGWLSLVACGLIGSAFGPVWSTLVAQAAKCFPENSAGAIGLMSTGCGLGGIVYPTLMGALSDRFSIGPAFLLLAATSFAGFVLCLAGSRKKA
jgi:MFS family permease